MNRFGDGDKKIWFNEFGTSEDDLRKELLIKTFSQKKNLEGFFWFSLRDIKPKGWNFGLLEFNFTKKDDYYLFKELNSD